MNDPDLAEEATRSEREHLHGETNQDHAHRWKAIGAALGQHRCPECGAEVAVCYPGLSQGYVCAVCPFETWMTNPNALDALLPHSAKWPCHPCHQDFPRRGRQIFESIIRPGLHLEDTGKFVAIDVDSEGYEINENDSEAKERLLARFPQAQIWLARVGKQATH